VSFSWRRWTVVLAGLVCLALVRPRLARAQAEELPAEPGTEHDVVTPTPRPPSQAPDAAPTPPQVLPAPSERPTILLLPYLGFTLPVGEGWAGYGVSMRFGALLGWHVTDRLSLNGECDVEHVRPDLGAGVGGGGQASGSDFWSGFWNPPRRYIDVTASPLVSFRAGQIRLGPKLGWFTSKGADEGESAGGSGLLLGFNLGLFLPRRTVTLGGLFTGSFRAFTSTQAPSGAHHTMGLLAAVLL
jgi:hypothetical protein